MDFPGVVAMQVPEHAADQGRAAEARPDALSYLRGQRARAESPGAGPVKQLFTRNAFEVEACHTGNGLPPTSA